ncbi:hypothetical protein K503DRAFT_775187 [Rhizopogon vinicolor AM-OR11-026]|uniref:DUF6533 domain-containing protein n=1 Tax=Rhizopogon vinicolor AM-OR11-026 TaxID=1314800 RepID=A0A1B7MMK0_9AGAM|nr:hypothetical protein K503DRAFT_775187 [Rhizopogon vinicolor AM-OR11-026]
MTSKPLDGLRILNVIIDYRQRPTEYVRVAPIAVWVLEYFLNLDREVQLYTSMKRWSIPLTLFLLARYMPAVLTSVAIYNDLSPSVDANQCTINYTIVYTGFFLVMTASEGLLLMRSLALWHDRRLVKVTLIVFYSIVVMAMLSCHIASACLLDALCTQSNPPSDLDLEITIMVTRLIAGLFCSVYCFELAIVISTVIHVMRPRYAERLVTIVTYGSLFYVSVLLLVSTVNITLFLLPPTDGDTATLDIFEIVLHSTLACRIFFRLREACEWQEDFGTTVSSDEILFAPDAFPLNTIGSVA